MKKLQYMANGEPHHKPKVFFACHPDDCGFALPLLGRDILSYSNCVIWYSDEEQIFDSQQEMEFVLDDMQLLTIAVTDRFLSNPSEAKDMILPYAIKSHIPILPITLEPKLGRRFNKACAKIQVIRKYVTDPTETPYEEVLKTYLHSVLVSDETAQKVRSAFDAYVFLSYRKMDRRHAKRLMHLIHENEEFRDIAIWYDEYLIPGRNFHDAIDDAFNKSSLFALAVTPNVLIPGNFVKDTEYKMAHDRIEENKKKKEKNKALKEAGKEPEENEDKFEIVPVELYEEDTPKERTNMSDLSDGFPDIPEVEDEHNTVKTNAAFISALERIGKKSSGGDAQHRFFIGLAYLCGIDVEKNPNRALELITSAATDEKPCCDATEKLVDMYTNGEGVEPNAAQALRWQKTLVEQYKKKFEENHSPDEHLGYGTKYFFALIKLSDLYRRDGKNGEAIIQAGKAESVAGSLEDEVGTREASRDFALATGRLGDLYRAEKDYVTALEYFKCARDIYEELAKEIGTRRARRDLSVFYERMGDLERKTPGSRAAVNTDAEKSYNKALEIRQQLYEETGRPGARRDISVVYTKLGNLRADQKDIDGAEHYYTLALQLDRVLAEELKTYQSRDDYAVSLNKSGNVLRARGNFAQAADNYLAAKHIYDELMKSSSNPRYLQCRATCCEKLASAYKHSGSPEKADECYREAIADRESLVTDTADSRHELAVSYYNYANFCGDKARLEKALGIWKSLSEEYPEYKRYAEKAESTLKKLFGGKDETTTD